MAARSVYEFDHEEAARAYAFYPRYLSHAEGDLAGRPFHLAAWQKQRIIGPLYGWRHRQTGLRKYRMVYIEIAKKNGKSTLGAGTALKMLVHDGEPGAKVFSCAADKDQAKIIFNIARVMVETSPMLSARCVVYRDEIVYMAKNGIPNLYKVVSADAFTKHGLNPYGVVFDELHAQASRELWDVMTGSSDARAQPILFVITNAGTNRSTICFEQHEYALDVISGKVDDPTFLPVLFAAKPTADIMDRKSWYIANPNLGVEGGVSLESIEAKAKRAAHSLSYRNTFRRFVLSIWTATESAWIDPAVWRRGHSGRITLESLKGQPCIGGLDLAGSLDFNAMILFFPPHGRRKKFAIFSYFWIPEEAIDQREAETRQPIRAWVDQGFINATPGYRVDQDTLIGDILQWANMFDLRKVGVDEWQSHHVQDVLINNGLEVIVIPQNFRALSEPVKEIEAKIVAVPSEVEHFGNPVLSWMMGNVILSQDAHANFKPDKKKSKDKIDGVAALMNAMSIYLRDRGKKPSIYDRIASRD